MNDIEILENIITEYSTQKEDYKNLTVPIRFDEKEIEAIEHAITALKERQADKDRIKQLEELKSKHNVRINDLCAMVDIFAYDSIPKSLVKEKIIQDKADFNKSVNANLKKVYKARIEFGQELLGEKQDLQINKEE